MKRLMHRSIISCLAIAFAASGVVQAQDDDVTPRTLLVNVAPTHWIGVHAIPVDGALKSHLQLEDRLIVVHVVPDSPAADGGLQQHDILLKFGDNEIRSLKQLMAAVKAAETNETAVTILRSGKEKTLKITPTERPAGILGLPTERPLFGFELDPDNKWRKLQLVGPGILLDGSVLELPEGLSINIQKEDDKPAKITVKRGDDRWEVTEDTLDDLPEDLKEHAKRRLRAGTHRLRLPRPIFRFDPDANGHIVTFPDLPVEAGEAMKRLEKLQRRLNDEDPFKALQEQIEALRREIEKLRDDRSDDEAKSDEAVDA